MAVSRIAAMVLNDRGELLPYTAQGTVEKCEEWCEQNVLAWDKLKELGARVVTVEVTVIDCVQNGTR